MQELHNGALSAATSSQVFGEHYGDTFGILLEENARFFSLVFRHLPPHFTAAIKGEKEKELN